MSAEEAVTDALQQPIDQNAQAAEDAKKMLAEIDADTSSAADTSSKPESNGAANGDNTTTDVQPVASTDDKQDDNTKFKEEKKDGRQDRDHRSRDQGDRRERRDRNDRGGRGGRGRGRGGNFSRGRDNIKSVLTREESSDDPVAIRKQVEFYFSDSNLPQDKFLFEKVGGPDNNPVELSIICTFKRMRHFKPMEAVVAALKDSKTLKLVDDDTKVQRNEPLANVADTGAEEDPVRVYEDKAMPRSVYVKGFGQEVPSTQFDVEAFFAEFGPTNAIRLRRSEDKLFKGSAFVEFETEQLQMDFLAKDPKPQYQGKELQIMSKKEYCEKKVEDIKAGKIKASSNRPHGGRENNRGRGGRGGRGGDRRRDGDDDRDWRTRRDEDRKNGFRDDKRRDNRDSRDQKGGRDRRRSSIEKDGRGIPVIKTGEDTPKDKAKSDALAQAKAAVEAENQKQETGTADSKAQNKETDTETKTTDPKPVEGGVKRERDEEGGTAEERPAKKVDVES